MSKFLIGNETIRLFVNDFKNNDDIVLADYNMMNAWRCDNVIGRNLWPASRILGMGATGDAGAPDFPQSGWAAAWDWFRFMWEDFGGARYLQMYSIVGVTKDSGGSPLGQCTVHLFRTINDQEIDQTMSDDSGNFCLYTAYISEQHYVIAMKPGSPNVGGVSVNTLTGNP